MIKFLLVRDVKAPKRATSTQDAPGDVAFDFFVPEDNTQFRHDLLSKNPGEGWGLDSSGIDIMPGYDVLIPSGVHALIPWNEGLFVTNKSGQAIKKKIRHGADTIDPSYEGEMHIHIFNDGKKPIKIGFGEKIAQMAPIVFDTDQHEVFTLDDMSLSEFYAEHNSDRGAGGFGSTGI